MKMQRTYIACALAAVLSAPFVSAQILQSEPVTRGMGGPPPAAAANGENGAPAAPRNFERSRKAPEGSAPPIADPKDFSGVWVSRISGEQTLPTVKPELEGKVQTPQPSGFATPNIESRKCHPSPYFNGLTSYPMQVYQTDNEVVFLFEENRRTHRIHLNADLPENPTPSHYGTSVGHWEGDTLVVDTVGLKHDLDYLLKADPNIRVEERMKKSEDGSELHIDVAYYNDEEWATPGTMSVTYDWRPDYTLLEVVCEEYSDAYGRGYDDLR